LAVCGQSGISADMTPLANHAWNAFREQMPVARKWAYFDHAAVAPLPEPVRQAMLSWTNSMSETGVADWPRFRKTVEIARKHAAELLNAQPAEIALIHSTTEGINLVAEGVPWKPGDNVVTLASEFPSNLYPWMNLRDRGVEVRQVGTTSERTDLAKIAEACDARTRILSISWVGYATGWRNDLAAVAEIAHRAGAKLFVDAIQGLGVYPLDVEQIPVDFLAADGHKWLLGPEGAGIFYVRGEHLDWLRPLGLGWNSVAHAGDFANTSLNLKPNAGRYEGGTSNMVGIAGLTAALELLGDYGTPAIAGRILEVTDALIEQLQKIGATIASAMESEHRSGILAVTLPEGDPQTIKRKLLEEGVVVNCRHGRLRVSPHVYNNGEDIEKLIAALKSFDKK
jgi:selenocysteine lyase/cysteine desulfurase